MSGKGISRGALRYFAPSESAVQRALLDWFAWVLPDAVVFAVPNGGKRDKVTAAKMKREGILPGAPDLIVVWRGMVLFIEVKTQIGRLSVAQKVFRDAIEAQGLHYIVVRDTDELNVALRDRGVQTKIAA